MWPYIRAFPSFLKGREHWWKSFSRDAIIDLNFSRHAIRLCKLLSRSCYRRGSLNVRLFAKKLETCWILISNKLLDCNKTQLCHFKLGEASCDHINRKKANVFTVLSVYRLRRDGVVRSTSKHEVGLFFIFTSSALLSLFIKSQRSQRKTVTYLTKWRLKKVFSQNVWLLDRFESVFGDPFTWNSVNSTPLTQRFAVFLLSQSFYLLIGGIKPAHYCVCVLIDIPFMTHYLCKFRLWICIWIYE